MNKQNIAFASNFAQLQTIFCQPLTGVQGGEEQQEYFHDGRYQILVTVENPENVPSQVQIKYNHFLLKKNV